MENLKIALLVDVENYKEPMGLFGQFVNGIKPYGVITRKVAIGGWGFTKHLENWKSICNDHNIEMLGYNGFEGKNAADRAIVYKATQLI